MRILLLLLFATGGALYTSFAFQSFREETFARADTLEKVPDTALHPEANLRIVREAMDTGDYTDRLLPRLERAFEQAPSFYQPPLLLAAFRANRLELPEQTEKSFEAALTRFGSNGRLHLSYGEWLLTPRPTAPYRAFRERAERPERTAVALDHVARAAELEPELSRQALTLLVRFRVPPSEWAERLPRQDETRVLVLDALDRAPIDRATRREFLIDVIRSEASLDVCRAAARYAERWNELDLVREAATKWRAEALGEGLGEDVARATSALVRRHLADGENDEAYRFLRESLATMEERSFPTEHTVNLLCFVADQYLQFQKSTMAQALLAEAITLSPYHVPAHLGLARTYRAMEDLEAAIRELERVLEIDPANSQASRELQELRQRLLRAPRR